jgi:glycosyltransferase involved in cell wall biosynthesis
MKISILLPYKENFSENYAGAVSIFVRDIVVNSNFNKTTKVYGNTSFKKTFLKNNYINLPLKRSIFSSTSKIYIEEFLKSEKFFDSDIIEIHNRPNYIKYLKNINKKKILYFHNDPLSMDGSKRVKDRIYLLNHIDKILFNSKWSQKRFFIGLQNTVLLKHKTSVCYQSTSKTNINFNKKKKIISFIGKLNSAKGYDLFGKSVIKILNEYPDWEAIVIGDEPREKINFKHERMFISGYTKHQKVLNLLKKVSISVVCSRWDEPFGRTSLEASSRGCAVIISNNGGLPETSPNSIILKKLNTEQIYKEIKKLIKQPLFLKNLQKKNFKSFIFNHKYIANLIDSNRKELFLINKPLIKKSKLLKIMHITNFNDRFDGRLHYNSGRRLNNGFIRNNHNVLSISDRDVIHNNKKLNDLSGSKILQKKILTTYENFNPDLVVLGHADKVNSETLEIIKNKNRNIKISQWFLDPLSTKGPDFLNNKNRILDKIEFLDNTFLTTDPESLSFKIKNSNFIPNPCDMSFEILSNYNKDCNFDVFFAMSHGVHRGFLKKGKNDDREKFINDLIKINKNLSFDIYGMNNIQPIWGEKFLTKISNCYMGLNLSRGAPIKYYSSDRIAQLIGNGLLTFVNKNTFLSDFFSNKEIVFYNDLSDLSEKLSKYKIDKKIGKKIAMKGKQKYFKYFNSNIVSDYIISKTFDIKSKHQFIW